jgi:hypothetical protein
VASWTLDPNESALRIAFTGHLSAEEGRLSAAEFRGALKAGPRAIVWDVRRMTGYDGFARTAWQHALWDVRQNIRGITVIGGSSFVRVGAWTIALFLGVSCRFVEDTERTAV